MLSLNSIVPTGYERDPKLLQGYLKALDSEPPEILRFTSDVIVFRHRNTYVELKLVIPESPCWTLMVDGQIASASETRKANFAIADAIGLLPAAFYEFLVDYDEAFVQHNRKTFQVSCHLSQPYCIRPSHLRLYKRDGHGIQTAFKFSELLALQEVRIHGER